MAATISCKMAVLGDSSVGKSSIAVRWGRCSSIHGLCGWLAATVGRSVFFSLFLSTRHVCREPRVDDRGGVFDADGGSTGGVGQTAGAPARWAHDAIFLTKKKRDATDLGHGGPGALSVADTDVLSECVVRPCGV
jgi:hypothetical protein